MLACCLPHLGSGSCSTYCGPNRYCRNAVSRLFSTFSTTLNLLRRPSCYAETLHWSPSTCHTTTFLRMGYRPLPHLHPCLPPPHDPSPTSSQPYLPVDRQWEVRAKRLCSPTPSLTSTTFLCRRLSSPLQRPNVGGLASESISLTVLQELLRWASLASVEGAECGRGRGGGQNQEAGPKYLIPQHFIFSTSGGRFCIACRDAA